MMKEKALDKATIDTYHEWIQEGVRGELNSIGLGPGKLPYRLGIGVVIFGFCNLLVGILLVALRMRHVYLWDWDAQFLGPFFFIMFLLCMAGATYLMILAKRRSHKYRSELYFRPVGDWGVSCVHKSELARADEIKHDLKSGTTPHKTIKPSSDAYSKSNQEARKANREGQDNRAYDRTPTDSKPFRPERQRNGPPPDGKRGPPPDGRRGPPPDGHRGPPPDGRRGPPPDGRRGPPPDGRRGPPPDGRRGPPPDGRRGPPPDGRRGPPPGGPRCPPPDGYRGPPPDGRRGPPPGGPRGPPPDGYRGPPPDGRRGPPPDGYRGPPPDGRRGPPPDGYRGPPPGGPRGPPPNGHRGPPPGGQRGPPPGGRRSPPPNRRSPAEDSPPPGYSDDESNPGINLGHRPKESESEI